MTVQINGTNGLQFNDASSMASAQVGMKNRIIDGGFTINQRGYVSGTSLSSGAYAHDRFKAGASGCTYTFTQGSLGVNTTITITAGSLIQVIEGANLPEGGTYVLSWTGTAQGRLNGGTFGSSGTVTVTGWVAGTNLNVEFNTGTCGNIQLEKGSTATSFDYRPIGTELALCQRYFQTVKPTLAISADSSTNTILVSAVSFPTQMRATPTVSQSGVFAYEVPFGVASTQSSVGTTLTTPTTNSVGAAFVMNNFSSLTFSRTYRPDVNTNSLLFSAEL